MLDEIYNGDVWHDSSIEKIVIAYNDIVVELETDTNIKKIILENYIAIEYVGQWDENIVESIYEEQNSDLIQRALSKVNLYNNTTFKGGGTRVISSDWKCIVIKLIDGVCIRVVCNNVIYK